MKRTLSVVLSVLMILSCCSALFAVFAEGPQSGTYPILSALGYGEDDITILAGKIEGKESTTVVERSAYTHASDYLPGDANGNKKIDAQDYAMIKRHYLKTYTLAEDQFQRSDINLNGKIDAAEYAMVKRHYLGNYKLPESVEIAEPGKTYDDYVFIVVGADNKVISVDASENSKGETAIPEGGYIIGFNKKLVSGDAAKYDISAIKEGTELKLEGVTVEEVAALTAPKALENASFSVVVEEPQGVTVEFTSSFVYAVNKFCLIQRGIPSEYENTVVESVQDIHKHGSYAYWSFATVEWNAEEQAFVVSKVLPWGADTVKSREDLMIPEDGFVLGAHSDHTVGTEFITALKAGDKLYFYGADEDILATERKDYTNKVSVSTAPIEGQTAFAPKPHFDPVPEGATEILTALGWGSDKSAILVRLETGEKTIGEIRTTTGENAYTWWAGMAVDADGRVIKLLTSGAEKDEEEVPEGGYIIVGHGASAAMATIGTVSVGDIITLYNVDLAAIAKLTKAMDLENAAFTVTKNPDVEYPISLDKPYTVSVSGTGHGDYNANLTDGIAYESMSYSGEQWFAFGISNMADGIGTITIDLGQVYWVDKFDAHHASDNQAGVAYPSKAVVSISADGEVYTVVGELTGFPEEKPTGNSTAWAKLELDASVQARYVRIEYTGGTRVDEGHVGQKAAFAFLNEIEVWEGEEGTPAVEPYKAIVNVDENDILTDGKTGFDGNWGAVGPGDVLLVANKKCTEAPMIVNIIKEFDAPMFISGVTLDLYHCAGVMIGYPEGKAGIFVSDDGENYTEVGQFDFAAADLALGKYGTVSSAFTFDAVEGKYVKIVLSVGSSTEVLGDSPADGKVFWEFISVAEVAITAEVVPERPISYQKPYTVAKSNGDVTYWSNANLNLKDDGKKLTDGSKGNPRGDTLAYTAVNGLKKDDNTFGYTIITVDLGEAKFVDTFNTYTCGGNWGIPAAGFVRINTSIDGENFNEVGFAEGAGTLVAGTGEKDSWSAYMHEVKLDESVSARYVQFEVYTFAQFCWIDEVEVWEGEAVAAPEIDGVLDDAIWEKAEFKDVKGGVNATWQTPKTAGEFSFSYAMAQDDEYLYVAAVVDDPECVYLRIWMNNGVDASWTHLLDVNMNGTSGLRANRAATFADVVEYKFVAEEKQGIFELKVKLSDLGITKLSDLDYKFQMGGKADTSNLIETDLPYQGNDNFPWTKWYTGELTYDGLVPFTGLWTIDKGNGALAGISYSADHELTIWNEGMWTWPSIKFIYPEADYQTYEIDKYQLSYDFTAAGGNTNILLFFSDGSNYSISNTALGLAADQWETGSGDILAGTYTGKIKLADLVASKLNIDDSAFPATAIVDGKITITGIKIFALGGATVTVREFAVEEIPETGKYEIKTYLGYANYDVTLITRLASGEKTLDEILYKFKNDKHRDWNYYGIIVVGKNNRVTEIYKDYGLMPDGVTYYSKADVEVPEGGYVIGINGKHGDDNDEVWAVFNDLAVGDKIKLYGVDFDIAANVTEVGTPTNGASFSVITGEPMVPEKIFDLESIKAINKIVFTPDDAEAQETVKIYVSLDGESFYDVTPPNSPATFKEGVFVADFSSRGVVNARYIKVTGVDVEGSVDVGEGDAAAASNPEGPYPISGVATDSNGTHGIVLWTASDVPEGFGINDKTPFSIAASQITIAEKVANGVYKILWNDTNVWQNGGHTHPNAPTEVEGVKYENDKIYLGENQVALINLCSNGTYAKDGIYSTAKFITRGLVAGNFIRVEGDEFTLHITQPEEVVVKYDENLDFSWVDEWTSVKGENTWEWQGDKAGKHSFDYAVKKIGSSYSIGVKYYGDLYAAENVGSVNGKATNGNATNLRIWMFDSANTVERTKFTALVDVGYNGTEFFIDRVDEYSISKVGTTIGDAISFPGEFKAAIVEGGAELSVVIPETFFVPARGEAQFILVVSTPLADGTNNTALFSHSINNEGKYKAAWDPWDREHAIVFPAYGEYTIQTFAGYEADTPDVNILARLSTGEITVNDVAGKLNNRTGKRTEYNMYKMFAVNSAGIVVGVYPVTDVNKSAPSLKGDVVIPEGGYVIGVRDVDGQDAAYLSIFDTLKIGDKATLYGTTVEALAELTTKPLDGVTFDVAEGAVNEKTVNVKDNAILTDGETGFTGDWGAVGTAKVVLVGNDKCTESPMKVTIIDELDKLYVINGYNLDLYHDANVMIGYPEGKATVSVSADGETYTEVGQFVLAAAEVSTATHGTVANKFEFDDVEAKFVKIELFVGSNHLALGGKPADGKCFWEFISIAEVGFAHTPETENILELEAVKGITGVTLTPYFPAAQEKVMIYGSIDGEEYFDLNAGAEAAYTTDFSTRGVVNVKFIKVTGTDVSGVITFTEGEAANASNPEGPYPVEGIKTDANGTHGIVIWTNADVPEGFGVNDSAPFAIKASQITIAKKVANGVYQILWNDTNVWNGGHTHVNTPADVEEIRYENDKIYLADDQIAVLNLCSNGTYAKDGILSTAKYITRGLKAGDFVKIDEGTLELHTIQPEPVPVSLFTEDIWAGEWTTAVPGENAGWQNADSAPAEGATDVLSYDYKYFIKDGKIYVGVKANLPLTKGAGNGESSFLRAWFKTDDDQTSYAYFYEVYVKEDDTLGFRAANNTANALTGGNNPVNNEASAYEYNMQAYKGGVEAYVIVPLDEIGATDYLHMFITYSIEKSTGRAVKNQCLYAPGLGTKHIASGGWNLVYDNIGLVIFDPEITLGTNLALNKEVIFEGTVDTATYTGNLTDGKGALWGSYDNTWRSFKYGTNSAIIDLGEVKNNIGVITVNLWPANKSGIVKPDAIEFSVSTDGTNFTKVGEMDLSDPKYKEFSDQAFWIDTKLADTVSARYVKMSVTTTGNNVFIAEVEVYDVANAATINPTHGYTYTTDSINLISYKLGKTLGEIKDKGHQWWDIAVVQWNVDEGAFVVKEVKVGNHDDDNFRSLEVPTYGFLLGCHDTIVPEGAQFIKGLTAGDKLYLYNVDLENITTVDVALEDAIVSKQELFGREAYTLDVYKIKTAQGYATGDVTVFTRLTTGESTLKTISAKLRGDAGKDYHAYAVIVVGADGKVVKVISAHADGDDKSDVEVPDGGYIIGYHSDAYIESLFNNIFPTDEITLANVDLEAAANAAAQNIALTNAFFGVKQHEHVYGADEVVEPTCVSVGYTHHVCTICGHDEKYPGTEVPATGVHTYDTEVHGSFVKHYCTVCGDWYFTDADNNKEAVSDYKISHLNAYNWQGHETMIFSREGKTVKEINSNFSGSGWIAYEVTFNGTDYVFAQFKSGADVASMVVPEGGFLVVACSNNGIYNPGKGGEFLGYVCYPNFGLDAQWGVDASAQPQNLRHLLVMNPEATSTNLALGKTYTTTAPNREDTWDDNGKKLTDGYKPVEASNDRYAAWKAGVDVEIVVDLGESVNVDTFKLFAASQSDWGIVAPAGLTVEYSTDGENFTKIDVAAVITNVANSGLWGKHELKVALDAAVSARYVKFTCEHGGDHVWISEVEVFNLK